MSRRDLVVLLGLAALILGALLTMYTVTQIVDGPCAKGPGRCQVD